MKYVAIVTRQMIMGGVEKALISMLKQVDYQKVCVDLYVEKLGGELLEEIPKEVGIYEIKTPRFITALIHPITGMRKLMSVIQLKNKKQTYVYQNYLSSKMLQPLSKKYDVAISYHAPNTVPVFYVIDNIRADKKILWLHGDLENNQGTEEIALKYYRKYDAIYGVSKNVYDSFVKYCPEKKKQAKIFYNFVDIEGVRKKAEVGDSYSDNFNGKRILTIARLDYQKGLDMAVRVCYELKRKGYPIRWYVCGEGSQRKTLEEMIKNLSLEQDFILLGNKKNPYTLLKECDLYVQTSRCEGYCTTTNEARMFFLPVITTNVSGAAEQFVDGKTGWIVPITEGDIFTKICWCLKNPSEVKKVCRCLKNTILLEDGNKKLLKEIFE